MLCFASYAQSTQAPLTQSEFHFLRFMLMNLASVDHDQNSTRAFESALIPAFGLTSQEAAAIHTAAQSLNALLTQIRKSAQAITVGKKNLSSSDLASLSALATQRETLITNLASQLIQSVRPQTAARLRMAGTIAATGVQPVLGGK